MKQKQNIRQKYQVTLTAEAKVTAGQVPMTDNGTGGDGIWWTVGLTRGSWDGAGYESFFPVLKYKSRPANACWWSVRGLLFFSGLSLFLRGGPG
jgi:hypothetical protein